MSQSPNLKSVDSFQTRIPMTGHGNHLSFFSLSQLAKAGFPEVARLPFSKKILLESVLRNEDGRLVTREHICALANPDAARSRNKEIPFHPSRVLLQDFTGVPALVDLAAMRSALADMGGDPTRINPLIPAALVIDHSIQVDEFGTQNALETNTRLEFDRNRERYEFLHWGQSAFDNFKVIPPASGICHQVNLEYLATVAALRHENDGTVVIPDTLVGTDSHTTMINGLGVLGWGVGGIEAEASMLGQPLYMLIPEVIGFRLVGRPNPGVTATDMVLHITELLRNKGVVGTFVEFFGEGLGAMKLADRATIANMAPEYGATMGFFPVDAQTLLYLKQTGRSFESISLVEDYCRAQGIFYDSLTEEPRFDEVVELDLATVVPGMAGPKRPQDRNPLALTKERFRECLTAPATRLGYALDESSLKNTGTVRLPNGETAVIEHGTVVIAAITSCTNTSNPAVMIGAGLLARNAVEAGLRVRPWVKTSLAPGSRVVTEYLEKCGLTPYLDLLGFQTVGYGCTTCIGNSGPLPDAIRQTVEENDLLVAAVLSGNRNFEGRINPSVKPSFLASPPLVVAYALCGTINIDITRDPLGVAPDGHSVYLRDIWPDDEAIAALLDTALDPGLFRDKYADIETGNQAWNRIPSQPGTLFPWSPSSTYIQHPPFFREMNSRAPVIQPVLNARVLVVAGDSTTTDHISPAGAIPPDSPAADYLRERGIARRDWNSFGSRRGNDQVMTRGTFGNPRFTNLLLPETEGGITLHFPTQTRMSIFAAAERYRESGTPVIVIGGKDYGMGSSRDWAAKGTFQLGVRVVIAESFERIHRSNLVGMGVLPLQFEGGQTRSTLGLTGQEIFSVFVDDQLEPLESVNVSGRRPDGEEIKFTTRCRIDTPVEINYYRNGGILHTVLREMAFPPGFDDFSTIRPQKTR